MKNIFITIFIISLSYSSNCQNLEEALNLVNEFSSSESLSEFKETHPKVAAYISKTPHYEVNKEKESLINTEIGEIAYVSYENQDKQFVHKVLDRYVGPTQLDKNEKSKKKVKLVVTKKLKYDLLLTRR